MRAQPSPDVLASLKNPSQLKVYVENTPGRGPTYDVTATTILQALEAQGLARPATLTVAYADARIQHEWEAADILVTGRLDTAAIGQISHLKMIQCTSAGIEKYLPLDWLPPATILCNASGAHAAKIREFGAMAVLMLHERVPAQVAAQAQGRWVRNLRPTSKGKRVLFYGAGSLGGALAEGLGHFGFTRIAIGREAQGLRPHFDESYGPEALETELARADILVIAAPSTPQTRGRFGAAELALLPEGAGLLNIARADLLDHKALVAALASGRLSGAILDVFPQEPLPNDSPLWQVPNLMISPHVSADDPSDYAISCMNILARNLAAIVKDKPLINYVDPELGY